MTTDIVYLEKSELLTKNITSQLGEISMKVVYDENLFFPTLFEEKPFLIIVGDSGSTDAMELLYCLRSIRGLNRIPVIFYGENEYKYLLPVNMTLSRNENDLPVNKRKIEILLNKAKSELSPHIDQWEIPTQGKTPYFQMKRAKSLMYDKIYQEHLFAKIRGINIIDVSFNSVLRELCQIMASLLLVDFVFILFEDKNILHVQFKVDSECLEKIKQCCLNSLPQDRGSEINQVNPSFGEGSQKKIDEHTSHICINEFLTEYGRPMGNLIAGIFAPEGYQISHRLVTKVALLIRQVLCKASHFYHKIDENKVIYKAFTQFLPAPIIDDLLLKESEKALLTGEKRKIVVLFCHIHHFDEIIDNNQPQSVVGFLNSHFSNMVKIIKNYGGSIDKFIGDAVFAIFGAPISYLDNIERAAKASMEMIECYKKIPMKDMTLPDGGFSIGIGLNEGEAIIGNIGCVDKFDYTAIGDTVNLAARLESLTKHYKQEILISKVVAQQIQKFRYCRFIDRAKVKGKNESTEIFSLVVNPEIYTQEWRDLYSRGLKMYTLGNWYTASEYFEHAQKIIKDDTVCCMFLERCATFLNSPPEKWDGAVTLDFK